MEGEARCGNGQFGDTSGNRKASAEIYGFGNDEVKEFRTRASEVQRVCQRAIAKGGSSETSINAFIEDLSHCMVIEYKVTFLFCMIIKCLAFFFFFFFFFWVKFHVDLKFNCKIRS